MPHIQRMIDADKDELGRLRKQRLFTESQIRTLESELANRQKLADERKRLKELQKTLHPSKARRVWTALVKTEGALAKGYGEYKRLSSKFHSSSLPRKKILLRKVS